MKRVAVIGAGASGLMASCFAADRGASVVLFEKQKKIGRKILVSGNGRCNITNRCIDSTRYHGHNPEFVNNVFGRFGLEETVDFFKGIGLPLVEEERGKLYPASLQSSSVVSLFEYELRRRGVDLRLHRRIDRIRPGKGRFALQTAGQETFECDALILAAGSCAFPAAGASRGGYELARSLGHRVHEPFPSILPINIPLKIVHRLQGIKRDCGVLVRTGGKILASAEGELLFTAYGISGPAALEVSRAVNRSLLDGVQPEIVLDLFPGMERGELGDLLESLWEDGDKGAAFSLTGILKKGMPEVLLTLAGTDPGKKAAELTGDEKRAIAAILKECVLLPGEPRGFEEAVVAAGGVEVTEINPATMESRIVKNLFLTGELLDIDGDSGGFNLQFAWSTGALAGMCAGG